MITKETIDRIVELGMPHGPLDAGKDGDPFALVPNGMELVSLAEFLPPKRIRRNVCLQDAGSFADYVNRFKTDNTMIFAEATETALTLEAILDYHGAAPELKPARCEHRATYQTCNTPEWREWLAADRKAKDQVSFATWLEDNAPLFREPAGSELLELVRTLTGKSDVRFQSAIRLDSGSNRLHYDEDVELRGQVSTREGDVELPTNVLAGIAPFYGSVAYEVRARLKYRIEGRKLALWFETISVHAIIRDAILGVTKFVAEKTGIVPLLGKA